MDHQNTFTSIQHCWNHTND